MAKQQTFDQKAKTKSKPDFVNVKCIKAVKQENGYYKFDEKFVRLKDVSEVTQIK